MLKLKVCMVGATGVGKTSLVARFLHSIFSARYETTIGVRIQARRMRRGDRDVDVVLWDLNGEDEFQSVQPAYLRGSAGYLLVADGTRPETLGVARALEARARSATGARPFVLAINKSDLEDVWALDDRELAALEGRGWAVVKTSAKTGAGVEEALGRLVDACLVQELRPWT